MSIGLFAVLVPVAVLVLALLVVVVVVAVTRESRPAPSGAADAARRHAAVVSVLAWLGLATAMVITFSVTSAGPVRLTQGVAFGLVPAVGGIAFVGIHALGELTWPRPSGTVRRAALMRRTIADVAPPVPRWALLTWTVGLVVTLVVSGLVSDNGRRITRSVSAAAGSASAGPFPGWYYGVPLLAGAAVVLAATAAVLRLVARRPAVVDAEPEWDLGLRRLSAHRVLRGAQLVLALTLAGVLAIAGAAVRSVGSGGVVDGVSHDSAAHAPVGTLLAALAAVVLVAGVVVALVPGAPVARPGGPAASATTPAFAPAPGPVPAPPAPPAPTPGPPAP